MSEQGAPIPIPVDDELQMEPEPDFEPATELMIQEKIQKFIEKYRVDAHIDPNLEWSWDLLTAGADDSENQDRQFAALKMIRNVLSLRCPETLDALIGADILLPLPDLLRNGTSEAIVRQALKALGDIVLLFSKKGGLLVEANMVSPLVQCIGKGLPSVYKHAITALGEIINESPDLRDAVIKEGYIAALAKVMTPSLDNTVLSKISTTMLSIYTKSPTQVVQECLPDTLEVLKGLIKSSSTTIQFDTLSAIKHMLAMYRSHVLQFIDSTLMQTVLDLFDSSKHILQISAVVCVQVVISALPKGFNPALTRKILSKCKNLLGHQHEKVRVNALKLLTYMSHCEQNVALIIEADLVVPVLEGLYTMNDQKTQSQSVWLLRYMAENSDEDQIMYMHREGVLESVYRVFDSSDMVIIGNALQIMLQMMKKCTICPEVIAFHISEIGVVDKITRLQQQHPNSDVNTSVSVLLRWVDYMVNQTEFDDF